MKKLFTVSLFYLVLFALTPLIVRAQMNHMPDTAKRVITYPGFHKLHTFGGRKQFSQWSLGANAGVLMPFSPVGGKTQYAKNDYKFGYGGFLKWQIQHSFGLRLDYAGGQVSGHGVPLQNSSFNTTPGVDVSGNTRLTYAASMKAEVDVASIDFLRRQDAVRAFVTAGYGLAGFRPTVNSADNLLTANNGRMLRSGFIPIGFGFKFRLSEGLAINLGYDIYMFNAGNLYMPQGTVSSPSKMGIGYGGLEYTFGGAKAKALVWNNPVAVLYDNLKDNDSLEHQVQLLQDNQAMMQSKMDAMSKDSDGDGVPDAFDKCPNTNAGVKVDGSGCDLPKMDTTARIQKVVIERDIQIVREAVRNLTFENNSTVISQSSDSSLNRLGDLLVSKPNRKLKLTGYTDNVGSKSSNLKLSDGRARSVKDYLVQRGVPEDQIVAKGMGPAHPIASNKTATGRSKNRRVEFNLF